ncbi:MAG: sigma 54-interacting transcriptional regulator [Proteobacteria bacterium]|nr:sigma 54-interacting transcriptional regulator [Pseudomonadota bacterium]MBU1389768.1 sigma 54-interacting transcriptional regulator [Pseudomonadota bacterium]MBU1543777.1 sigma 54-interacting transcriptional regulator [Pseudomonadota bacterium]MBU2431720.1 sigma 54-interacting transcriptional regulator [Pseudomonadota bacterium]MBU2480132.1 sigma 54-interacting transcriptional regulator [Pseudomonadota bacterium]
MDDHSMNIFWKKIVNTINDGLMFVGPEGSILMVNKAFETLTGYTSEDIIGMSCSVLGCDACEQTLRRKESSTWCKLFEPGHKDMKKCQCQVRRKDGSFLPVLKNASILWDETRKAIGVVETLTDISEMTRLDEKLHILSRQCELETDFYGIVGQSPVMIHVFDMIQRAAQSKAPVIITGESGTGKELVANAIHLCGSRKNGPFIQLNCAALNEAVLESELFGHAKGAFTGAYNNRIGRFEAANQGDFFLDEIGDIPMPIQTKLLRVLESGQFERVGDIDPVFVDVRIITATNKDLDELIRKNEFRQDLLFRINVIPIHLPALRDRKEDIPLMISTFIQKLNTKTGKTIQGLSYDAMESVMEYPWPGNIRELKNAMEYAFVTTDDSLIQLKHLPKKISMKHAIEPDPDPTDFRRHPLPDEKSELINALKKTRGNQSKAAQLLNINRVTVWNRIKKYSINLKELI